MLVEVGLGLGGGFQGVLEGSFGLWDPSWGVGG